MNILAIGDFHGKFPSSILGIIRKYNIQMVVSIGDYCPYSLRKLFFKNSYKTIGTEKELPLWMILGKNKYKAITLKDLAAGERVLKKLNSLPVPVYAICGNIDHIPWSEATDKFNPKNIKKQNKFSWVEQDQFSHRIKKYSHIINIGYKDSNWGDFTLIGKTGSSFPGHVKSKAYKKLRSKLEAIFIKNKNKTVIFLTHNVPYDTKLDKITSKDAHHEVRGEHYGCKMARRLIEKYQPLLAIGGHIHEGKGTQRLGKTLVVNTGSVHENEAAIINIYDIKKRKMSVKFIKIKS